MRRRLLNSFKIRLIIILALLDTQTPFKIGSLSEAAATTATAAKTSLKKRSICVVSLFKLHRSQFVTCWRIFLELNSKCLFLSLEKENENLLQFTFYIKREIGQSHVVVVQRRQRNVQNSVMHVHSCCFANLNLLVLCRSRCLRRRLTSCGAFAEQYLSCCTLLHHFGNLLR